MEHSDPVMVAAWTGNLDVLRKLVVAGRGRAIDDEGATPLHYAAWQGHVETVRYLIGAGYAVDARDRVGLSPLHHAVRNHHLDVQGLLEQNGATLSLHEAVALRDRERVLKCLEAGADADARNAEGETPLFWCDDVAIGAVLVHAGASVRALDSGGYTPIHSAAREGNIPMIDYLVTRGANVDEASKMGFTPLHVAWLSGEYGACSELIRRGAMLIGPEDLVSDLTQRLSGGER